MNASTLGSNNHGHRVKWKTEFWFKDVKIDSLNKLSSSKYACSESLIFLPLSNWVLERENENEVVNNPLLIKMQCSQITPVHCHFY